jgi:hypothetical protein
MSLTTVLSDDAGAKAAPARRFTALGSSARLALGLLLPLVLALGWEIAVATELASGRLLPAAEPDRRRALGSRRLGRTLDPCRGDP